MAQTLCLTPQGPGPHLDEALDDVALVQLGRKGGHGAEEGAREAGAAPLGALLSGGGKHFSELGDVAEQGLGLVGALALVALGAGVVAQQRFVARQRLCERLPGQGEAGHGPHCDYSGVARLVGDQGPLPEVGALGDLVHLHSVRALLLLPPGNAL